MVVEDKNIDKDLNVITVKDWSSIKNKVISNKLLDNLKQAKLTAKKDTSFINLGLYLNDKGEYSTKGYVGIIRLKDENNKTIYDEESKKECILNIEPRFGWLKPVEILNELKNDDEFLKYMLRDRKNDSEEKLEIEENKLFHFYKNEPPIKVAGESLKDTNIISTILFINVLTEICKRSLMGKMQKHEENLTGKVKGKILFNKNIKNNLARGRKDKIYCQYQSYSVDILENQILKYGLYKAKKVVNEFFKELSGDIKRNIAYCDKALEEVSFRKISLQEIKTSKVSSFYANYKPALQFAKMLIEGVSIDADGNIETNGYVTPYAINMQDLFEFYVRKILKDEIKANYKDKIKLDTYNEKYEILKSGNSNHLQKSVKPDIVLKMYKNDEDYKEDKNEQYIILDAKYKDYDKPSREDTLQILAYGMLFNCKHIGLVLPMKNKAHKKIRQMDLNIRTSEDKKYYYEINIHEKDNFNIIKNIIEYNN